MSSENQDALKGLTTNEIAYMRAVLRHTKARLDVDWNGVVEELELTSLRAARQRFQQISVKHSFCGQDGSPKKAGAGESPNKVTKKRAPRAKKAKKEEESESPAASAEDAPVSDI